MSDPRRKKPARAPHIILSRVHVKTIEDEIERLIAILDLVEPDSDLEETGDFEPYLAGEPSYPLDAELDYENEPSLGSLDRAMDQRRWNECDAICAAEDLELDRADFEDGHDAERDMWPNPLGAKVDGECRLIVERVPDRQVRP